MSDFVNMNNTSEREDEYLALLVFYLGCV